MFRSCSYLPISEDNSSRILELQLMTQNYIIVTVLPNNVPPNIHVPFYWVDSVIRNTTTKKVYQSFLAQTLCLREALHHRNCSCLVYLLPKTLANPVAQLRSCDINFRHTLREPEQDYSAMSNTMVPILLLVEELWWIAMLPS